MPGAPRDSDTAEGSHHDPQTPSTAVNYTFVNQAEDLVSLSHRRINNKEQRHTIRSHVMTRVRQVESAQGKKRSTGREHPRRPTKPKQRKSSESESLESDESKSNPADGSVHDPDPEIDGAALSTSPHRLPRLNITLGVHQIDPFDTLPTNGLPHESSESLLQYCFDVMLPLTFSVEIKQARDRKARQGMVLNSKMSSPASFLGFLATTAAHRAVLYGRHKDLAPSRDNHENLISDPDYARVKHEVIRAVRQVLEQCPVSHEQILEACFGLISTNTVVGNFEEARLHLKMLDRITSQIEVSEDTLRWLPISNTKLSVALLEHPVMPLLIVREPIPDELLQRIGRRSRTATSRMGQDLAGLGPLSEPLRKLLSTHADVCRLCEVNLCEPQRCFPQDGAILTRKAIELEFDLLAYPYQIETLPRGSDDEPKLPAFEALVRLVSLGMLSISPHTIMPATGNGRALTHHQRKALELFLNDRCSLDSHMLKFIFWALFVFIQNSLKQPEEVFFTELLAEFSRELWVLSWDQAEEMVSGFLYIPASQSEIWNEIWKEVCKVRAQSQLQNGEPRRP